MRFRAWSGQPGTPTGMDEGETQWVTAEREKQPFVLLGIEEGQRLIEMLLGAAERPTTEFDRR